MERMAVCEPYVMEGTLDFVDQRWGGLDEYLDSIGFVGAKRDAMRVAMAAGPAASATVPL